jgi:hypothetical protein
MLRYKAKLDELKSKFCQVDLEKFLRSPDYSKGRSELNNFLSSLHWSVSTIADFWCLSSWARKKGLPHDVIDLPTRPNSDRSDELAASALVYIFDVPEFQYASDAVLKAYPDLDFDDDGLLTAFDKSFIWTKDGLVTRAHFIPYDPWLAKKPNPRNLSGGLIESLLRIQRGDREIAHFGLRIDKDFLIERSLYSEMEHRAHVWGPKGLNEERLQSASFPEVASGTLTVHQRFEDPETEAWLNLLFEGLSHIEVMWSRRDHLKSVQIEELVHPSTHRFVDNDEILVAYLHSIWDCSIAQFIHIDGAVKSYSRANYDLRFNTTMNKFDSKADRYKKLFRLDTNLSVIEWADLVSKYFYNDELIIEYLSGTFSDKQVTIRPHRD